MTSGSSATRRGAVAPAIARPLGLSPVDLANRQMLWRTARTVFVVVLLVRAVCDPLFELTEIDFGGARIGAGAALNALVVATAALLVALAPRTEPTAVFGYWAPFLLAVGVAVWHAPQFGIAARMFIVVTSYWAMFVAPFFLLRERADVPRFILLVLASSVVPTLFAFVELAQGASDLSELRIQSTFTHPNIYAFYLVLLVILGLFVRASQSFRWPPRSRAIVTLYLPLLLFLLLMTKTRSAWLACALVCLVYAVWIDRRFLLTLLVVPVYLVFDTGVVDRLLDLRTGAEIEDLRQLNAETQLNSFAWREVLWQSAMPWIIANPFVGHGLESFRLMSPDFFPLTIDGIDSHNLYIQLLFETGLPGLLAFAVLVGAILARLFRGLAYDRRGVLVMMLMLATYLIQSYADNMIYYLVFNWYFWFVLGTVCAWIGFETRVRAEPAPGLSSRGAADQALGSARRNNGSDSRVSPGRPGWGT